MLIHLQPSRSSWRNRFIYLLKGTKGLQRPSEKVEILHGDPEIFGLIHKSHSREVRYFNLLITFKESKEELEEKLTKYGKTLKDLHDEILSYVLPYDFEDLNILTVGHADTDHYHWHITVDNQHLGVGKALYLPKTKLTIRLYDRLRRYISAKYGISLGIPQPHGVEVGTKKLIEKLNEKGKEGTSLKKEQVRQLITEQLKALILTGDINSRKDVEDYIEQVLGLEINRRGKSYISIRYGKAKIRLSGGIYDEQRFRQVAEEIRRGEEKDLYEPPERAGELEKELRELVEKYRELVRKRLEQPKRTIERPNRGEIGGAEQRDSFDPNESTIQNLLKGYDLGNFSGISGEFCSWRSDRLDKGERTGRAEISGKSKEAGEDIRVNQSRVVKGLGDKGSLGQTGKVSLPSVENGSRYEGRESLSLRKRRKILYSVRPSPPAPHRTLVQKLYGEAVMEWELERQEELEAIKRIPPEVIFQDLGIEAKRVGHRLCIYAPWREETKPSVFIEQKPNGHYVWKDFGSGKGGTWIDFFMELYDWDYVESVKHLRERYLGADIDLANEVRRSRESSFSFGSRKYELVKLEAKEVTHSALKRYLRERGISKIPKWLKEVHYQLKDKETGEVREYFALGVQTLSGSWILRNPMVKMNLRTADDQEHTFAYISRNGNKRLVIVEGLFDALSIHQIARRGDFDLLILSGIGNTKKLLRSEICERYGEILVATDMDKAGEKFFRELFDYLVEREKAVTLKRIVFNTKDLNEAVVRREQLKLIDYTRELKERVESPEDNYGPDFSPGM